MAFPLTARYTLAASALLFSLSGGVIAQDNVGDDSTVVYRADYFAEFNPITAQDMVNRIPGVGGATGSGGGFGGGAGGGNGGRGLGGGGGSEIIINGKRMAGKSNQASGQLDRITAGQVDYIELIRGTSGDLDVRGSGVVVNVILLEELSATAVNVEINMDRYADGESQPGGSFAISGNLSGLGYVLSAVAEPRYDHRITYEDSMLGDFTANDAIREDQIREQTSYDYSANLDYEFSPNSSARLNALYSQNDNPTSLARRTVNRRVYPNTIALQREELPGERDNWEIGADYELRTEQGSRFKGLVISNQGNVDSIRKRYDVADEGSEELTLFLDTGSVTKERIARGSYTFDFFESQDVEIGIERAQTILDSRLAYGVVDAAGTPDPSLGGLVAQSVSNAVSTVEEMRYEPFLIHNWQLSSQMSLETSMLYESSEISQSGKTSLSRDFGFFKPKVDFRYDLTPQLQIRATVEKRVRQLRFGDFVASNDDQDNDSNVLGGNENLKPEWLWAYDLKGEYRLPNDVGVVSAGVWYHEHFNVIERIDATVDEDNLQSIAGNIGDGHMYGLTAAASIRMRMISMPNLLITANFNVKDSSVIDPFLGIDRRFANFDRGRLRLGMRHDVTSLGMSYGMEWNNRFDANIKRYEIDDIELRAGDPNVTAFVQFVDRRGITYRFDARNANDNMQCRERQRFVGRVSDGILEEIEDNCGGSGRTLSLKINGNF
ncbi:MAG: TonB-dependent receptor [Gammaproteobacteria bacterium]|nr:TonB-dependent receptor [Gammaproteobacteria bacterium]